MVYASTLRHVSMGLHKSDKCTTFLRSHHRRTASTSSCTAFLALLGRPLALETLKRGGGVAPAKVHLLARARCGLTGGLRR